MTENDARCATCSHHCSTWHLSLYVRWVRGNGRHLILGTAATTITAVSKHKSRKRLRKGRPWHWRGLGKAGTGPNIKSTASEMARHNQQGQPHHDYSSEDGAPCRYHIDITPYWGISYNTNICTSSLLLSYKREGRVPFITGRDTWKRHSNTLRHNRTSSRDLGHVPSLATRL